MRAGLSAGFLSQIERGLSSASIRVLARIADALDMSFGKLRSDAAVPGFRRGRVPQRLLEKRFGQNVRDPAVKRALGTAPPPW